MRELEFRARIEVDGVKSYDYSKDSPSLGYFFDMNDEDGKVELYTGLVDVNNKKIFEGDIIDVSLIFEGKSLPHLGEVVFDESFGAFGTKNLGGTTLLHNHALHTAKVIGNIYQNPELLKSAQKVT